MHSMTGYGKSYISLKGLNIRVQIRSVNHRFFNCQVNLPDVISDYNTRIEPLIRKNISRGSINLSVKIEVGFDDQIPALNTDIIKKYYNQLKVIEKKLKLENGISIDTILNLPGIHNFMQPPQIASKLTWGLIEKAIVLAIKNMIEMRAREGMRLKKLLYQILKEMDSFKKNIKNRIPLSIDNYRKGLVKRVEDAINHLKANVSDLKDDVNNDLSKRIAEEVAFFSQKSDITEEMDRIESHFTEFKNSMNQSGEIGKRLDFITQEMLREVNTIASKCNDAKIAHYTIALKSNIDKLKEQVQNIE